MQESCTTKANIRSKHQSRALKAAWPHKTGAVLNRRRPAFSHRRPLVTRHHRTAAETIVQAELELLNVAVARKDIAGQSRKHGARNGVASVGPSDGVEFTLDRPVVVECILD